LPSAVSSMPLLAEADVLFQHVLQRIVADVGGLHQPLHAAVLVGDDDDGEDIVDAVVVTGEEDRTAEDEEVVVKSGPTSGDPDGKRKKKSAPQLDTGPDSGFDEHSAQTDDDLEEY